MGKSRESGEGGEGHRMTDTYIEQTLIDTFLTLNTFSGIDFIKFDSNGKPINVSLPNLQFTPASDNRFFILSFIPNDPEPAGLGVAAKNRHDGIFQIDIMVPLGAGLEESNNKQNNIVRLFGRGKVFDKVTIVKCYRATHGAEESFYRTIVRVEFYAFLEKD
jgi:hypothetical protein